MILFKHLRFYFLLFFSFIAIGTAGLMVLEDYSFLDAMYMTVITITTVGYAEIHELGPEGRIFMMLLILAGFGTIAFAVTAITNFIFSGAYAQQVKQKKMQSTLKDLQQHVIVCGYGRVGVQAVKRLRKFNRSIVVIETNEQRMKEHEFEGVIYLQGDATSDEVLLKAGIKSAANLVSTLPNDADNLFVVVSARALNSKLEILSRASEPSNMLKIKNAGASHVIMPDHVGGVHLAQMVVQPDLMEFMEKISQQSDDSINFEEVAFQDLPDHFKNKTIGQLQQEGVLSCAIIGYKSPTGDYTVNPSADTLVIPNSKLFLLGTKDQVNKLHNRLKHN
jgi:voltage-gated potassium channel